MNTSINKLNLRNFKNYKESLFEFKSGFNLIWGKNGMGKTNVLDAIYYISNLKSNSARKDRDLIRHGEGFFRIEGHINLDQNEHVIQIGMDASRKLISFDEEEIEKRVDWIGRIPVWMISPEDDEIVKEGSAIRRKMMNHLLSVLSRDYLKDLMAYNRLLKQRNAYLKMTNPHQLNKGFVMAYSEQMNEFALRIIELRREVSKELWPFFEDTYRAISQTQERAKISYSSDLGEDVNLIQLHESCLENDIILRRTSRGPHRDDWVFNLGEKRLKYFGSQGQKKTFILSVKLSLIQLYHNRSGKRPILLLDDIFDKLDISRAQGLLSWLNEACIDQVIITDTELDRSELIFNKMAYEFKAYKVENGSLVL